MRALCCFSIVVFLSVSYFSDLCHAQYLTGPIAGALGGAGRAASDDGEQIFLNPAALVHGSPFTSSIVYEGGREADNEKTDRLAIGLSDNSQDLVVSGGYSYVRRTDEITGMPDVKEDFHQFALAKFVAKHVSMGGTFSYRVSDIDGEREKHDQWDVSVGTLYNPTPDFAVAAVVYNLASRDDEIPKTVQNLDQVAVGLHYIYLPMFRFRFDLVQQMVRNPDAKMNYQAGIESKLKNFLVTRVGFNKDDLADRDFLTFGLGFDGPRLKFDYSYRKNLDGGALHGVDLRMPFW